MRQIVFLLLLLFKVSCVCAQYTFQGKVEFERKVNIHRQIDDMMEDDNKTWMEKVKAQMPKFNVSYFDYYFNTKKSLYKPGRESENPVKGMWGNSPASENIVFSDWGLGKVIASKQIFEEKFLVQDSLRKLDWKIKDEIRIISGYKCRKAVSIICDSVYVVAFYTEDIAVSGGPEMFSGLPGMILEIAIPRLYSTWIALKVDIAAPKDEELKIPEKGKKVSQKEMYDTVMGSVSKWGRFAHRSVWWSVL
ncbi:MAG TPA: GLPGLI family protein [Flavipsychrobacter sp.]|nr:GLPGLI family protein [Flavipsychrobacter sp.]